MSPQVRKKKWGGTGKKQNRGQRTFTENFNRIPSLRGSLLRVSVVRVLGEIDNGAARRQKKTGKQIRGIKEGFQRTRATSLKSRNHISISLYS